MSEKAPEAVLARCPACGQASDSVKCFRMGTVLFLFVGGGAQWRDEFGCPPCIRKQTARFAVFNLLTANLLWPVLVLPMVIAHLVRSYQPGHSPSVERQLSPPAPVEGLQPRSGLMAVGMLLIGLALSIGAVAGTCSEYGHDNMPGPVAVGVGAFFFALGTLLVRAGRMAPRSGRVSLAPTVLAFVVFAAALPLVSNFAFARYERAVTARVVAEARDHTLTGAFYDYLTAVPPQFWRADGLAPCAGWRMGQLATDSGRFVRSDLAFVLGNLERYHQGDPQMVKLAGDIRRALAEGGR